MPIDFQILDDGHIVRYVYTDPWTMSELDAVTEQDIAHRQQAGHKVHSLAITKINIIAAGSLKVRKSPSLNHSTAGGVAIVGSSKIVRLFADTVLKLAQFDRAKFFDTEDEALVYLREIIRKEQSPL
jgi:hypothetical protein